MKKLVLVLAIVFAGIMSANAQVWVGGGVNAQIQRGVTAIELAPEVGYCINNQWQVALGMDYSLATGGGYTAHQLYLEPYVRYVGGTIGKKFSLFVDLCGDIAAVNGAGYAVMLRPGIAWQATEKFTAAFRFGFAGYDHNFKGSGNNGFVMACDLAAPQIRIYYNL